MKERFTEKHQALPDSLLGSKGSFDVKLLKVPEEEDFSDNFLPLDFSNFSVRSIESKE